MGKELNKRKRMGQTNYGKQKLEKRIKEGDADGGRVLYRGK